MIEDYRVVSARIRQELKELEQVSLEIPKLRPVILSQESVNMLNEYLAFRHVVRNVYAFQFDPLRVERLVNGLPSVISKVKADLESFATFLEQIVSQSETEED